jgi:hypothetical protein
VTAAEGDAATIAAAIDEAIEAMIVLEPTVEAVQVYLPLPGGAIAKYPAMPLFWGAWQATLSVLDEPVTVAPA